MNKYFRRTAAGISALAILAAMPCMTAFAAEAETETEAAFSAAQLPVLHYSAEDVSAIDCRFYEDLPSVPYVKLTDYYTLWVDNTVEITELSEGVYEVKVPYGTTGVFDTVKDTVTAEDRLTFLEPLEKHNGEDYTEHLFVQDAEDAEKDDADKKHPLSLDLASYDIDLRSSEGELWCPLPTLCDMFYDGMRNANYIENILVFGKDISSDFANYRIAATADHANAMIEQYQNGRPADLIKYNYNELCFTFDLYYGFPGRSPYTELMREKGLDGLLSEANDSTRRIKEFLLSDSLMDYSVGIDSLNMYTWDGGHTAFSAVPLLMNKEYLAQFREIAPSYNLIFENSIDFAGDQMSTYLSVNGVDAARKAMLEDVDYAEQLSGAFYVEKGDTAIFSFDQFMVSAEGWKGYYLEDGEMPSDVLTSFYQAISRADANPAIKNFVLDLGTNVGGVTLVAQYMMNIMTGLDHVKMANNTLGTLDDDVYIVDKNLDKAFDEKDAAFKPDLRYGVITSHRSFSCGNWMPSLAKDNGILLMGEQSGGGACAVEYHVSADGIPFSISTGTTLLDQNGESIDAGIKPHYENVKYLENGTKDFSETYNFANISKYFDEFYGTEPEITEPVETEPAETGTTAETTTTETTTTATTEVTSSETTAQTSETTATETTASQTAEKKYSVSDLKKMASKDYESKNGKAPAKTVTKENADGTVSIELTDASGKVLDTYTIDPATGTGKDSKGGEVNLPQTGNNSLGTVSAVALALLLLGAGSAAVAGSGILRKKDEE